MIRDLPRAVDMARRAVSGETFAAVGERYGISGSRAAQQVKWVLQIARDRFPLGATGRFEEWGHEDITVLRQNHERWLERLRLLSEQETAPDA